MSDPEFFLTDPDPRKKCWILIPDKKGDRFFLLTLEEMKLEGD